MVWLLINTSPSLHSNSEWLGPGPPGFLGPTHAPVVAGDQQTIDNFTVGDITIKRLGDWKSLLVGLDRLRRDADVSGSVQRMDILSQQAFSILTSSRLTEALNFTRENPRVIERYGRGVPKLLRGSAAYHDIMGTREQFLVPRQLVETGVRCVTLTFGMWDFRSGNFAGTKNLLPKLDQAITALVEELHERSLARDVSVVVWGEFGRSPKINDTGDREHGPQVSNALLAGGGMRTSQTIRSTDRHPEEVKDFPIHYQEVLATLYHNLGIDVGRITFTDFNARPHYLLDATQPITELV